MATGVAFVYPAAEICPDIVAAVIVIDPLLILPVPAVVKIAVFGAAVAIDSVVEVKVVDDGDAPTSVDLVTIGSVVVSAAHLVELVESTVALGPINIAGVTAPAVVIKFVVAGMIVVVAVDMGVSVKAFSPIVVTGSLKLDTPKVIDAVDVVSPAVVYVTDDVDLEEVFSPTAVNDAEGVDVNATIFIGVVGIVGACAIVGTVVTI